MYIRLRFGREEIERLFLTYLRQPKNYLRIKETVLGKSSDKPDLSRLLRGRILFLFTLALVALVGSGFAFVSDNYDTIAAIWVIWLGALILIAGFTYLQYQETHKVWKENHHFFEHFEQIALQASDLSAFNQHYFDQEPKT